MAETPELILAVQLKNLEKVQSLLQNEDVNVNVQDSFGDSSLHFAASNNQLEILKLLIEKGANVNIQNNTGATALHKAAAKANRQVIQHLLPLVDATIKTNSGLLAEQFTTDNEIWKSIIGQKNLKREKIFVESDQLGGLIGKGGKKLLELQTASNTRIMIPKNNNNNNNNNESGNTEITITGREDSIAEAIVLINEAVKPKLSKQEQILEDENISHKVKVATKIARNKFGRIIGAKGKKIAEIEETFGVRVIIPKFEGDDVVSIYGEDDSSVQGALGFIFELIKDKPRENNNNRNNNRNNSNNNNNNNNSNSSNNSNSNSNNNNRNNNRNNNGEGRKYSSPGSSPSVGKNSNSQVIKKDNTVVIKTNNYLRINSK